MVVFSLNPIGHNPSAEMYAIERSFLAQRDILSPRKRMPPENVGRDIVIFVQRVVNHGMLQSRLSANSDASSQMSLMPFA